MTDNYTVGFFDEPTDIDDFVECNGEYLSSSEAVDRLNELHDENKRLKRQIGNLEQIKDFCSECCERLEKENEQLKSKIKEVREAYEQLWVRSYSSKMNKK